MSDSILDSIGTVSFLGLGAYTATQFHKNYSSLNQEVAKKAAAVDDIISRKSSPATVLKANAKEMFYDNMKTVSKMSEYKLADFRNTKFAGVSNAYHQEITSLGAKLTNNYFKIGVTEGPNGVASIAFNFDKNSSLKIGSISYGGVIDHASTGAPRRTYTPQFMSDQGVSDILNKQVAPGGLRSHLEQNVMDINLARVRVLNDLIDENMTLGQKKGIFSSVDQYFSKFELEGSFGGPNSFNAMTYRNSIVPIRIDGGKMVEFDAHSDVAKQYVDNFTDLVMSSKDRTMMHTIGKSEEAIASGQFLNPFIEDHPLAGIISNEEWGGRPFNQAFRSPTQFVTPEKLYDPGLAKIQSANANISAANTYYIPENDKLFGALTQSGIGTTEKIPYAKFGDEGYLASYKYANQKIINYRYLDVAIDHKTLHTHVSPEMNKLVDELLARQYSMDKNIPSRMYDRVGKGLYNKAMLAEVQQMGSADMGSAFRKLRTDKFNKLVSSGRIEDVLKSYGGALDVSKIFKGEATLAADATRKYSIGKEGMRYISDISMTNKGLRFQFMAPSTMGNAGGKIWFSMKSEMLGSVDNVNELVYSHLALNKYMKEGRFTEEQVLAEIRNPERLQQILSDKKYGSLKRSVGELDIDLVTRQKVRNMPKTALGQDETIKNLTSRETIAYKNALQDLVDAGKIDPSVMELMDNIHDVNSPSIRRNLISAGLVPELKGYNMGRAVDINNILLNRLQSQGYTDIVDDLISNYTNLEDYKTIMDDLLPSMGLEDKRHIGLELKNVFNEDLGPLYGENVADARFAAEKIAKRQGIKDISADAKYFIRTPDGRSVPIPTTATKYTSIVNETGIDEAGDPIYKLISSKAKNFVHASLNRDAASTDEAWKAFSKASAEVIGDPNLFIKNQHPYARLTQAKHSAIFDADFMNLRESNKEVFDSILSKYGLNVNSDAEMVHGYNSKRFLNTIKNDERYIERFNKSKAQWDDIEKLYGSGRDAAEIENMKINYLKGEQRNIANQLMKEGVYEIAGRDPAYAHGGMSVSRLYDMQAIHEDLVRGMKGSVDEAALSKFMKMNYSDADMFTSERFRQIVGVDLDQDTIKSILLHKKSMQESISNTYTQNKVWQDAFSDLLGSKAGFKSSEAAKLAKHLAESSQVEKEAISKLYNAAQRYSMTYVDNLAGAFSPKAGVSSDVKARLFDHFMLGLPERAIGAKQIKTFEEAEKLLNILEPRPDTKSRAKALMEFSWTGKNGRDIFELFSEDEIARALKLGDDVSENAINLGIKSASNFQDIHNFIRGYHDRGGGSLGSMDANSRAFSAVAPDLSKTRSTWNRVGQASEDTLKPLLKSKAFWGIAAGSVLVGMLAPRDARPEDMEVKEMSKPKRSIPTPAAPIDPSSGYVNRPQPPGYKYTVKGKMPMGVGVQDMRNSFTQAGLPVSNTYIDKTPNINAEYIRSVQNEDKLNRWNLG